MINKNRQTDSKTEKQSWIDVFARTQKLKSSGDESWKKDVPNIKLSRAFIVVLILHVVAVGGILAFEMFKPNENIASTIPLENEASKANDDDITTRTIEIPAIGSLLLSEKTKVQKKILIKNWSSYF